MGRELFVEIGSEEIPAAFVTEALSDMEKLLAKALAEARLSFDKIESFGTPRRLIVVVNNLSVRQDDVVVENQGPAKKVAFDESGNPTKALVGFAKGHGVDINALEVRETPKGAYIYAVKEEKGGPADQILPALLETLLTSIPFKKSMRWKDLDVRFARPVHWMVALFGGDVIDIKFGDVQSSSFSRGHRFLSPDQFEVRSFEDYRKKCSEAYVIIDGLSRKSIIKEGITKASAEIGGHLIEDVALLEEVANLVEYPVVLRGGFDEEFLKLPKEIIINAMREHQRYFSVVDDRGNLLPYFITVSNTAARDMNVVRTGNERVLRARLSDASFYYYEDLKTPLDEMVDSLGKVVFQAKLGTSYEKVERFRTLAGWLADKLAPELKEKALRAAFLSKGDLVSGVVCEFPSLQGVMGRDYAIKAGEEVDVAEAIFEHYLPRNADDMLPASHLGAIVSMADKMDTICGCFGIGLTPTGASDPYALRRQTLGIINIILDKKYRISLSEFIDKGINNLQGKILKGADEVSKEVLAFFRLRLHGFLTSKGYPHDVVDAVLARKSDDILDAAEVIIALSHLKNLDDFEPLAVAFKRVVNITKEHDEDRVDPSLFEGAAEKALYSACRSIAGDVSALSKTGSYKEALLKAAEIRPHVDTFFDDILVMVEDERLRINRLSLLKKVSGLFAVFADFSKIVTEHKR